MEAEAHWHVDWRNRPAEEARIFNPAFCAELIARATGEYYRMRKSPIDFAVAFLILPLLLHKGMCDALPRRSNVAFAGWVADHGTLLAETPDRTKRLRPISREAIMFAIQHQALQLKGGGLLPGAKPINMKSQLEITTNGVDELRRVAAQLGRWFAAQGNQVAILQGMGVMP